MARLYFYLGGLMLVQCLIYLQYHYPVLIKSEEMKRKNKQFCKSLFFFLYCLTVGYLTYGIMEYKKFTDQLLKDMHVSRQNARLYFTCKHQLENLTQKYKNLLAKIEEEDKRSQ